MHLQKMATNNLTPGQYQELKKFLQAFVARELGLEKANSKDDPIKFLQELDIMY